jgi:hypothetical protein
MSRITFVCMLAYFVFVSSVCGQDFVVTTMSSTVFSSASGADLSATSGNGSNRAANVPADSSFTAVCLRSVSGKGQKTTASQEADVVTTTCSEALSSASAEDLSTSSGSSLNPAADNSFTATCLRSVSGNSQNAPVSQNTDVVTTTNAEAAPSFTDICLGSVKNPAASQGSNAAANLSTTTGR